MGVWNDQSTRRCCHVEYLEKQIAELENDLFLLKFALRQIRDDQKMPESARKAAGNVLKVVEG